MERVDYCNWENGIDLIYLIRCALHGEKPEKQRVEEMNLEALYLLSSEQSLGAIAYMVLENYGIEEMPKWREYKEKAVRKLILQDAECTKVLNKMGEAGIWYMPMKGYILKDLYPALGMRQMSDNDIFFDKTYQDIVEKIMLDFGYMKKDMKNSNHDVYYKKPIYNFEMHKELVGGFLINICKGYYDDVKERLIPSGKHPFEYQFTKEDFYIYNTIHSYKHFSHNGCGLRWLVDYYVLLWKWGDELDFAHINKELSKLQMCEFDKKGRDLAGKLFGNSVQIDELTEEERETIAYCVDGATYGRLEYYWTNRLKRVEDGKISRATKWKYYLGRIFPSQEECEISFPFFAKHRYLKLFLFIYRLGRGIIVNRNRIKEEIKTIEKM